MSAVKVARKAAKGAGYVLGAVVALAAVLAAVVEVRGIPRYEPQHPELAVAVTPARIERGRKFVGLLCADCHMDDATGKLTGKHLAELPAMFGEIYSKNITQDRDKGIGAWTDGQLAYYLRTGVRPDGQYAPPWMVKLPNLADEDLASIIAFLRSDDPRVAATAVDPPGRTTPSLLAKALTQTVMKPLPYPEAPIAVPPRTERVAYGRYLAIAFDCYACHSADFVKIDPLVPERSAGYFGGGNTMTSGDGKPIRTANLTPDDETGIGLWSEADFIRAVRHGFRPDGRVLRAPMTPRSELDDDEVSAIYTYLRTVPKLRNPMDRGFPSPSEDPDAGRRLYVSYGCVSCHGDQGVGPGGFADLRRANEHYATDEELRAWIDDAPAKKPGTRMPAWKGVIAEADYGPLLGHVRKLSTGPRAAANR